MNVACLSNINQVFICLRFRIATPVASLGIDGKIKVGENASLFLAFGHI